MNGLAKIRIVQVGPASGINRVGVEIVRPPDPTSPTGTGVPIVAGETSIEWQAPDVRLSHSAPPTAVLGTNVVFSTVATNAGRLENAGSSLRCRSPMGSSSSSSAAAGPAAQWSNSYSRSARSALVERKPRQRRTGTSSPGRSERGADEDRGRVADQKGSQHRRHNAAVESGDQRANTGLVDVPVNYVIRLSNPGTGDLDEIHLVAEFDKGLDHAAKGNFLEVKQAGLRGRVARRHAGADAAASRPAQVRA